LARTSARAPAPARRVASPVRPAAARACLAALAALALLAAPAVSAQDGPPVVLLFDDQERVKEKRTDSNGDGRHDEFVYYEAGEPVRAEQDGDHDGRIDTWIEFGEGRKPKVQELMLTGLSISARIP